MQNKAYNVLFLCTGNSARSIVAEVLIEHRGKGRFNGYSAGSFPKGAVHPLALEELERHHLPTRGLRSKSWDEFAGLGAPAMDFVFTVCDQAASEACPLWLGTPVTAHWSVPDPAAVTGTEAQQRKAFRDAYLALEGRIKILVALPIERLSCDVRSAGLAALGAYPYRASPVGRRSDRDVRSIDRDLGLSRPS
jgi:arsenate reductase